MTGTASVVSCDGIFHPLCNVHSVITDTLEIFCSHEDIQTDACIRLSVIQNLGQLFLNIIEGIVHLIIIVNNLSAAYCFRFLRTAGGSAVPGEPDQNSHIR